MTSHSSDSRLSLHYRRVGTGPDVLCIHGWASSARMWTPLTRPLSDRARLWAVDLLGFGASPRPEPDQRSDIALHTALLVDFCERHHLRPRMIIGHSMGGLLALKLALARPDRIAALVLIAPVVSGRFGYPLDLNRVFASDLGQIAVAHSKPFWILTQNILMPLLAGPSHWYLSAAATERIAQDFRRTSWQAAAAAVESIAREDLTPHLKRILQPALVIVGGDDTTVPPDEGRLAAAQLPNGYLLELPGVHHQPLDEAPQVVTAAVQHFLAEI